jgi:hypothetical protein
VPTLNRAQAARADAEPTADPFGERRHPRYQVRAHVLGAEFRFLSEHRELLELARHAYAGLPAQLLPGPLRRFTVRLLLGETAPRPRVQPRAAAQPPRVQPLAGGGIVGGALGGSSFVTVIPAQRSGLVVVAPALRRFPYHVRYELIEFAVYCLAARAQGLVPLHAACVAGEVGAALVLGASGAGKSTLMLHSLLAGLQFLAEDSVLVRPRGLLATGVANFLHLRADSLRFLGKTALARQIRAAPVIRRRSGVRKYELDLRRRDFSLVHGPVALRALVFLSARSARSGPLLSPLPAAPLAERLCREQPYAMRQPGWDDFLSGAARLPAFELRRGAHPRDAVAALQRLLDPPHRPLRRPATGL